MLEVVEVNATDIECVVIEGGQISNHKGVNIPDIRLDMPYLNEKDKSDLLFGIENDVDYVSASFVRRKEDVICMRKFLDYNGGHNIKIISKIDQS